MGQVSRSFARLVQSVSLGLDVRTEIDWVRRVAAGHERQFAGRVVEQQVGELVAADDFLYSFLSAAVACSVLGGVDSLQHSVRIADEVEEEEGCWVGVWRLHLGV